MKRLATLLLALTIALLSMPMTAYAAGKLTVTNETFIVLPFLSYHSGEVYAELENTGDKPVQYTGGLLELYDAEGDSIEAEEPYRCYPPVLKPGEKGYLYVSRSVEAAKDRSFIDDYSLTVTGKGGVDKEITRYPATARYEESSSGLWTNHYAIATVTNDTEEIAYDFRAVFAVRDAAGNLLHVDSCEPSYVGIMPGSSVEIRSSIDSKVIKYYNEKGTSISTVEVIVYTEKKL